LQELAAERTYSQQIAKAQGFLSLGRAKTPNALQGLRKE
jgi:hypothetical protein